MMILVYQLQSDNTSNNLQEINNRPTNNHHLSLSKADTRRDSHDVYQQDSQTLSLISGLKRLKAQTILLIATRSKHCSFLLFMRIKQLSEIRRDSLLFNEQST